MDNKTVLLGVTYKMYSPSAVIPSTESCKTDMPGSALRTDLCPPPGLLLLTSSDFPSPLPLPPSSPLSSPGKAITLATSSSSKSRASAPSPLPLPRENSFRPSSLCEAIREIFLMWEEIHKPYAVDVDVHVYLVSICTCTCI